MIFSATRLRSGTGKEQGRGLLDATVPKMDLGDGFLEFRINRARNVNNVSVTYVCMYVPSFNFQLTERSSKIHKINKTIHRTSTTVAVQSKFLPILSLYYGMESCPLRKSQFKSLDFAVSSGGIF